MGLDMYLSAIKFGANYKWSTANEKQTAELVSKAFGMEADTRATSVQVKMTIGYWRKANAVHAWFVKNTQNGVDECQTTSVTLEQLKALRSDCLQVINSVEMIDGRKYAGTTYYPDGRVVDSFVDGQIVAQETIASKILPTQSGCFFGNTNYDEDYIQDLKDTVAIIDKALLLAESGSIYFEYNASW